MILNALPPNGANLIVAPHQVMVDHAPIYAAVTAGSGPDPANLSSFAGEMDGDSAYYHPMEKAVNEDFDWNDPRTQKEFIRLEQKVLARKASAEAQVRYEVMRASRNSEIFADRALRDYAEVQRLKKLSEKLADIQQYLRPIKV